MITENLVIDERRTGVKGFVEVLGLLIVILILNLEVTVPFLLYHAQIRVNRETHVLRINLFLL